MTESNTAPDSARYRPVVAIEVDGLLERPVLPGPVPDGVIAAHLTMRRHLYPTATRAEPDWDDGEEWRSVHWFSKLGVEWVKSALDEDVEVVWASTWREYANLYFSGPLGLPPVAVAVRLDGRSYENVWEWKARQLASRFDGRPLLCVTDRMPPDGGRVLAALRNPRDRYLTAVHLITPTSWTSDGDVQRMTRWVDLVRTPEGHDELRRLRRRYQAQVRSRQWAREQAMDDDDGGPDGELLYRQWQTLRERLEAVLGPDSGLAEPLAAYVMEWAGAIHLEEVTALREQYGVETDPLAEDLWPLLGLDGER